jgi:hypothetical protein
MKFEIRFFSIPTKIESEATNIQKSKQWRIRSGQ